MEKKQKEKISYFVILPIQNFKKAKIENRSVIPRGGWWVGHEGAQGSLSE